MPLLRILLLTLGLFGVLDTIAVSFVSSSNLGVLLPGILCLPLLLIGVFFPAFTVFFTTALGKVVKWLLICGYGVLFAAFLITGFFLRSSARQPAPKNADVLIVLGAGLRGDRPTLVLKNRMDTAIAYLNKNPNTVAILSGGKGDGEYISEAEAMARYFMQKGVPAHRYIKEASSTSTQENFLYANQILKRHFTQNALIVFVTTDFHVFRAQRVAHKQGIQAYGIAAPDVWYISPNNHLRECFAVWAYALTGVI